MCLRVKDEQYALEKRAAAPEGIAQKRKVYANDCFQEAVKLTAGRNAPLDQEGSVKVISSDETERSHSEARAKGGGKISIPKPETSRF
ncbi:hypothetical protein AV530_013361 [Patagioenas fasciata monilis]|uniref:Uncharacterized protein n=1 Tax=Patagioenas fasciata monilis TaxID=372326 RepID=A0A1V4JP50_PATFA|nr:hypothetical protein AV530_013361 [Patagioenas fasciata monilis]